MEKAARSYELSFISALWMIFPESWKRGCPNFYAHDCRFIVLKDIVDRYKESPFLQKNGHPG